MKTLSLTRLFFVLLCVVCAVVATAQTTPQITGSNTTCVNNSQYYGISAGNVVTWSITGSGNVYSSTGNTLQVLWSLAGTYSISAQVNYLGTVSTVNYSVTVNPALFPSIVPQNSNLCTSVLTIQRGRVESSSSEVSGTKPRTEDKTCYNVCDSGWYYFYAQGSAGSNFSWQSTGSATIVPLNSNADSVKVRWNSIGYTDLILTETDANGCTGVNEICIQVINKPTACITSAPAADVNGVIHVCLNSSLSLNSNCSQSTYGSGIVTRRWILGDGSIVSNSTFVNHTYTQAGTYTLMFVTESNCSCTDTLYRTVIVDASAGPDIYCVNSVCHDSVSTFTTSDPCTNLLWSVSGGTVLSGSLTANTITVKWGDGNAGYGVISLLSSCSGACAYPTVVYVPILPDSAYINGDSVVCNQATEIYSVPFVPTTVYSWYLCSGPDNLQTCVALSYGNTNEISYTWNLPSGASTVYDKYSLKVVYSNPFLGCSGYSRMRIHIADPFKVNGDTLICDGDSKTYNATSLTGTSLNCKWQLYSYSTGTTTLVNANASSITLSGLAVGYYTLYATSVNPYWCGNPVATGITVAPLPAAPTPPVIGPTEVCPNTLVSYFTAAAPAGLYIEWSATEGNPATGAGQDFNTSWNNTLPADLKARYTMIERPGCSSSWVTTTINQVSLSLPAITGPATTCGDEQLAYQIAVAGAEEYEWSVDPAEAGSIVSGQHTNTVQLQWNQYAGSVTATAQVNLNITKCGTVISRSYNVTLSPTPVANLTAATSPFCTGKTVTFTATPTSLSTPSAVYHWDFGDGTTATNSSATPTHAYTAAGTYAATVTIERPNGCTNPATAAITVDVLPGPAAILSPDGSVNHCGETQSWSDVLTVTLQNMSGTSFTYELFNGTTSVAGPGSTSTFTVTATGSYRVKVVNSAGCEAYTNIIVVDDVCPETSCDAQGSVQLSLTSSNCGVVTVNVTTTNATFTSVVFQDPLGNTTATTLPATHTYLKAGSYHIIAYGAAPASGGGTCDILDDMWVTVGYVPDFTVQYTCSSTGHILTQPVDISTYYPSSNAITSWAWFVDGNTTAASTSQVPTPPLNITPAGAHTLTLVIDNATLPTCTLTQNITVPAPAQAAFISVDSVCETGAVLFDASSSTGDIISYLWQYGDGSSSSLQPSGKVFDCGIVPGGDPFQCDFTTVLTVTDAYGCQSQVSANQVVYDDKMTPADVDVTPHDINACYGSTVNATVTVDQSALLSTSPYTYLWSNGATTNPLAVTGSGNYYVTVTDKYNCAKAAGPVNAYFTTINAIIQGDTMYCPDEKMNLSIFKGHQYTYQWKRKHNTTITGPYTKSGVPYLMDDEMTSLINGDTYWGVVTLAGCSATTPPVTVHQYAPVSMTMSSTVSPNTVCANEGPITLTVTTTPPSTVLWNNGIFGNTITFYDPGYYAFQLVDSNGCRGNQNTFPVYWAANFNQLIAGCYTRCLGQDNTLYGPVAPIGEQYTYQWIRIDNNVTTVVSTHVNYNPQQSGTYRLIIRNQFGNTTNSCVDTSDEIYLDIMPCPNTACVPEGIDTSCTACHYEADSMAHVVEFLVSFNYTGTTNSSFSLYCNTAHISAYENVVDNGSGTPVIMGHTVVPGQNSIHMEIWDTPPHQSNHQVIIVIGDCHIPVTITVPSQCE